MTSQHWKPRKPAPGSNDEDAMSAYQDQFAHYSEVHHRLMGTKPGKQVASGRSVALEASVSSVAEKSPASPVVTYELPDDLIPKFLPVRQPMPEPDRITPEKLTGRAIIQMVAKKHEILVKDMVSMRRPRALSFARQEAYWEVHQRTDLSLAQIGKLFSDRDHTTILYGIQQHKKRMGLS